MTDQPISRRRAETRHRLMEAALLVFAERGVLAASVEEICERAGFTRGAFYSNFESKNALVLAMLQEEASRSHQFITQVEQSGADRRVADDPELMVELTSEAIRATFPRRLEDRHRVMAVAEMRLHAAREPSIRSAYLEFRQVSKEEMLVQLLALARSAGWEFTLPSTSALEVLDAMYERSMLKAAMVDPDGDRPDLVDDVVQPFVDVMIAMIRPVGGATGQDAEVTDDVA